MENENKDKKHFSFTQSMIIIGSVACVGLIVSLVLKNTVLKKTDKTEIKGETPVEISEEQADLSKHKYVSYTIEETLIDEEGNETQPLWIIPDFIKSLEVDFDSKFKETDMKFKGAYGDYDKADFINTDDGYTFETLECSKKVVKELPDVTKGTLSNASENDLKMSSVLGPYLFIHGTETVEELDLSEYDLSNVIILQLYGFDNLKKLNIGNYFPPEKKGFEFYSSGFLPNGDYIQEEQNLFIGITDEAVKGIEEIYCDDVFVAKWMKKEAVNAKVFVKGEAVKGNLNYIVQYIDKEGIDEKNMGE